MRRVHPMPFGVSLHGDAGASFRLWAPACVDVSVELLRRAAPAQAGDPQSVDPSVDPQPVDPQPVDPVDRIAMRATGQGWHEAEVPDATAGLLYRFRVADGLAVPDPASRFNPLDVHGPSEIVDPLAYDWGDSSWRGRPWHEAVLYELHVGAFTPAGTFGAASERLDELARLGITGVELMPVAAFPGTRSWGYDGVLPYAPDASYGRPEDLKRFVDRAHALGMMVLLDVVYNHFGPEGNYLNAYAPQFFDQARRTPWGAAIDFDGPSSGPVRDYFVHNALYWVEEFGFDGLRLDAVHAIDDRSSPDLVESIARALREGPGRERLVHLVLENDRNDAHYLERDAAGPQGRRPRHATAQWNDDVHHAFHVLLTGESDGYYADYADDPVAKLGRALAEGFVYQGEVSAFRGGACRGEPSAHLPPEAFVAYLQTHDQIGNRAFGERLDALADPQLMPAALACLLLGPQVPMLFMGDEHAASTPFLFFCDFGDELADAVRNGRRDEFGRFEAFRDRAARESIPDPNALASFEASRLRWHERGETPHRERLVLVRRLLEVRQALGARFDPVRRGGTWTVDDGMLAVRWALTARSGDADAAAAAGALVIRANFGVRPIEIGADGPVEVPFSHGATPGTRQGAWMLGRGGALVSLERWRG